MAKQLPAQPDLAAEERFRAAVTGTERAPAPVPYAEPASGERVVYRNATVFDGRGGPARPRTSVVVDGPLIVGVEPDAAVDAEALVGVEVVELGGRFLLPGLIDTHQHLNTPPNRQWAERVLRRAVYGGVTAVRDMAGDLRQTADLARVALVGETASPDIFYAALMAGPAFFTDPRTWSVAAGAQPGAVPWMQAITPDTDLPLAVARAKGTGAVAIKIYAELPAELITAITAEAHRQDMQVWAHATVYPTPPSQVVAAGVDVISHTTLLVHDLDGFPPPATFGDAMLERDALDWSSVGDSDWSSLRELFARMHGQGTILDATIGMLTTSGTSPQREAAVTARLTAEAYRAGVTICTGTDGENALADEFPALHHEMRALAEAGVPAAQVIRAATQGGARAMGQQHRMGTITPGLLANLVILAEDPLADLANLSSVTCTIKRGRRFPREIRMPAAAASEPRP
ncbi:amidohydrolase family protein [Amycolatopsis sp. EV170708-02-1]|uniref:amidohydrolase family protein n=1 Tax=Amycolatopsis sp. EV170708-02-1 TaxID=2919322 RepID=UPI001F0C5567|nr:amidohydrolase family protein [Amycolatopsis sp. EV170708-02-1]UMP00059.1 amidohydrolase family protein [Amycolatopsis sp. EV170708-02-1]